MVLIDLNQRLALAAYYKQCNLKNSEIAGILRVDVSSISRYLADARKKGWLEQKWLLKRKDDFPGISGMIRDIERENELRSLFSNSQKSRACLREIVVVKFMEAREADHSRDQSDLHANQNDYMPLMAAEGGALLSSLLSERALRKTTLGVAWGRTTHAVVNALKGREEGSSPNVLVVPLQGGMGIGVEQPSKADYYPDVLAQDISEILNTSNPPLRLSTPAYIDYKTVEEVNESGLEAIMKFIRNDKSFRKVSEAYKALDIGLVGIGGLESDGWAFTSGYLSTTEAKVLERVGVCGDIVCRFYRNVVENPVEEQSDINAATEAERNIQRALYQANRRAIGISLKRIRDRITAKEPIEPARIIGVAGGNNGVKAPGIYGAIVNGYITDLVTDEVTACEIIKIAKAEK